MVQRRRGRFLLLLNFVFEQEEDEDVLLVSDWNQDDELDRCEIWDESTVVGHSNNRGIDSAKSNMIDGAINGSERRIAEIDDEEEEDVLLVGDYERDVEEGLEAVVISSAVVVEGEWVRRTQVNT